MNYRTSYLFKVSHRLFKLVSKFLSETIMSSAYTAAAGTSTLPVEPAEESSMLRSETMSMIQLYIPSELSHPTMAELGELGVIQFNDLQPEATSFSRPFTQEIRRLDESERRVRYLMTLLEKASIKPKEPLVNSPSLLRRTQRDVNEVEETLKDLEEKFVRMGENIEQLQKRFVELTELRHVLQESSSMMVTGSPGADYEGIDLSGSDANAPLIRKDVELGAGVGPGVASSSAQRDVGLNFVAGVINRDKIITFERILWRVLRGNLYMNQTQIDEPILNPLNGESVSKNVFIIFATGSELLAKIKKISEALGATIFPLSQSAEKRSEDLLEVSARLEDLNNVLFNSAQARRMELVRLSQNIEAWRVIIKKEKMIYHTMNLFNHDTTRKCLIAEGWCPTASVQSIQYALHGVCERAGSLVPPMLNVVQTKAQPPTYIRLNKFTRGYQAIIDAYGVAKYKEVNPGLFTVVTFPFLFAVMFGDWGHGFLMLFVALYLVIREKELDRKDSEEMFRMLFQGRYIILLMSIFSIYVGLIYNDIFSLCVFLTPSSWDMDAKPIPKCINDSCAYPFGIDPNWRLSANSMVFLNSYKMKMSILLGVTHMLFGIFLSLVNHRYYKKTINIIGEFIPQILFLSCLFGYLSILIIYKWLRTKDSWDYPAPGLLNTLIFMFLKPGTVDKEMEIYPGQVNYTFDFSNILGRCSNFACFNCCCVYPVDVVIEALLLVSTAQKELGIRLFYY